MSNYLSVSHLTKYLKLKFDRDPYLERVYLTGQVSNFRKRPSHQYFSLKDEKAVIQATMWSGIYQALPFEIEEGMKLNVVGRIQLYEPSGTYSIIIEKAEPDGIGALALQFEQLRQKLTKEGYFDQKHKQSIPQFVKKIGVITSPSGAVIKDIITTVSRRFAGVEIVLYPTKVQGEGAAVEIARHITWANQRQDLDLLIVGRGGGSIEDLWAFNEEIVVQAIFESRLPVISSVGHETDTTLADFVADARAATPTAAAELATPVTKADVLAFLNERQHRLYQASVRLIQLRQDYLKKLSQSVIFRQPERLYDSYLQRLDKVTHQLQTILRMAYVDAEKEVSVLRHRLLALDLLSRVNYEQERLQTRQQVLQTLVNQRFNQEKQRFEKAQEALISLDTSRIIARGYALIKQDDKIVNRVADVQKGASLTVQLHDGQLDVEVKNVNKNI